jgi:hypothetical protein
MINKVGGTRHFGKPSNMPEAENKSFKLWYYYFILFMIMIMILIIGVFVSKV